MTTPEHVELALIGTGSGNSIPPATPNRRTVIFEESRFGGTCLNAGCIPSKMWVMAARAHSAPRRAERLGIELTAAPVDWQRVRDRVFSRIDQIESGGRDFRVGQGPEVTVVPERVAFVAPGLLRTASGAEYTADQIVIAAGSRPRIPELPGLDPQLVDAPDSPVFTSETAMRRAALPRRLAIIGSGYVAVEMAHIHEGLGSEVTILARGERLLRAHDETVSEVFTEAARRTWDVRTEAPVERIQIAETVTLHLGEEHAGETVEADALLIAAGRVPNSDLVAAEMGGVDRHEDGRIVVDEHQRVLAGGVPMGGVFALGDVSSPHPLKHIANHEARIVRANLRAERGEGPWQTVRHAAVPAAVFSDPEVASVGLTEAQAREEHGEVRIVEHAYADVAYGWALEETDGFVKLITTPDGDRLIGAHVLGPDAATVIQPLITLIAGGQDPRELVRSVHWIHPALSEVVENALLKLGAP